jgi:hypothetical protein
MNYLVLKKKTFKKPSNGKLAKYMKIRGAP